MARATARKWILLPATIIASTSPAHAGMTVYGLNDIYRLRLEDISFFIFLLLTCALVFKFLWNYGFKNFNRIPRLKYFQALCLCLIFGLASLLILTMISGIREVLTPGAWRRQGSSYRLNDPAQEPARLRSLQQLRVALFEYARNHDGHFPLHDFVPEIPDKLWESPDQLGSHYLYRGGLTTSDINAVLAVEPGDFGDERYALLVSGEVQKLPEPDLEKRWKEPVKP